MKITKKNKVNNLFDSRQTHKTHKTHKLSNKLILGCHASITPSIIDGIKYVESINGNAMQIFLGNNRSASLKTKTKLTDEDIIKIKTYIHEKHITLIIHSIYLLNF
jgi:endonuclease IV